MVTLDFQDYQYAFYIAFFWPIVFVVACYLAVSIAEVVYVMFANIGAWLKRGRR